MSTREILTCNVCKIDILSGWTRYHVAVSQKITESPVYRPNDTYGYDLCESCFITTKLKYPPAP
jgi:hypothetical protein